MLIYRFGSRDGLPTALTGQADVGGLASSICHAGQKTGIYVKKRVRVPTVLHVPTSFSTPVPPPLKWMAGLGVVYVIVLAALPVQMVLEPEALIRTIAAQEPGLTPQDLDVAAHWATAGAAVVHGITAALVIWLAAKVRRRRQWARIVLTGVLVLATVSGLSSASVGGMFVAWAMLGEVIQVAMVVLIWAPKSVRRFFAVHESSGCRS